MQYKVIQLSADEDEQLDLDAIRASQLDEVQRDNPVNNTAEPPLEEHLKIRIPRDIWDAERSHLP